MANIITTPGKFQGELEYVPLMWDVVLEGFSTDVYFANEDRTYSFVSLPAINIETSDLYGACLWERTDGFVCSKWFATKQDYDFAIIELENKSEEENEENATMAIQAVNTPATKPCQMYTESNNPLWSQFLCANCEIESYKHADTFHVTSVTVGEQTLNAGDVVRLMSMHQSAFCDAVILGFSPQGNAKIARPYVYASSVGTTCANPLLGCETFQVSIKSLMEFDKVIDTGRIS